LVLKIYNKLLNTIIYSNKDKPDVQVKAVLALNETTVLIANLFEMLPNICSLGVDAFGSGGSSSSCIILSILL
jgi:hypothetical protein